MVPPARPEAELIELARRGDGDAYVALLRLHQDVAFRTAYLILGTAEEAEDVAQEACVKAFCALDRFHAGRPCGPGCFASSRTRRATTVAPPGAAVR